MWHYGLLEGMDSQVPPELDILEMATYVCPFSSEHVGCVVLAKSIDNHLTPFAVLIQAIYKGQDEYEDHILTDNLFIALMELESAKCALEVIVNTLAMANVMRVSQWN